MKTSLLWLSLFLLIACRAPSPKKIEEAKAKEAVVARLIGATELHCNLSEVTLAAKDEAPENKTTYRGTACGSPFAVLCQTKVEHRNDLVSICFLLKNDQASNGPKDNPLSVGDQESYQRLLSLLEPCRIRALSTYSDAKERYLSGLPKGQTFFVVVRLKDAQGHQEQVFVSVEKIYDAKIDGKIQNQISVVSGYKEGQLITVSETEIVDWLISMPDGSEEGNWSGKFMDALQETGKPPTGICDRLD